MLYDPLAHTWAHTPGWSNQRRYDPAEKDSTDPQPREQQRNTRRVRKHTFVESSEEKDGQL